MQAHCRILDKGEEVAAAPERTKKLEKRKAGLLVPDTAAILADFQLMGEGLVKRVEILSPPPSVYS